MRLFFLLFFSFLFSSVPLYPTWFFTILEQYAFAIYGYSHENFPLQDMAIVNQHTTPPVPPAHLPPTRPGEGPRIIHHSTPGPVSCTQLAGQLNQLKVGGAERGHTGNGQNANAAPMPRTDIPACGPLYEGYTFFKADAAPGQKSTWARPERTQLSLSQTALFKMAQKHAKKVPMSEQYQSLSKVKRTGVDRLVEQRKRDDPRFEWQCVYVKGNEKPFKGKNSRRGDYETVSMDVVIMRRPTTASDTNAPRVVVDIESSNEVPEKVSGRADHPVVEKEPRTVNRGVENNVHWAKANAPHQQNHVMIDPIPRQYSPQPPRPQPPQPVPNHPHPHPIEYSHGGGQSAEGLWSQATPVGAQQAPGMNGATRVPGAYPQYRPTIDTTVNGNGQTVPTNPNVFPFHGHPGLVPTASGALPDLQHPNATGGSSFHLGVHPSQIPNHGHEDFVPPAHEPEGKRSGSPANIEEDRTTRTPNLTIEPELEWPTGSSDTEDESILSGNENGSSVTEDSSDDGDTGDEDEEDEEDDEEYEDEEDDEVLEKPQQQRGSQPWRGSLYRRHSSPRLNRREPVYRIHQRKLPNSNNNKNEAGSKPTGSNSMEVVPAASPTPDKKIEKTQSREVTVQGPRNRPTIVHEADNNPAVLDVATQPPPDMKPHGGRMRNDIRTRILDDREARLEHREKLVDYHARLLHDKLEEARYLNRRMSLREPSMFPHSRRFPLPEDYY